MAISCVRPANRRFWTALLALVCTSAPAEIAPQRLPPPTDPPPELSYGPALPLRLPDPASPVNYQDWWNARVDAGSADGRARLRAAAAAYIEPDFSAELTERVRRDGRGTASLPPVRAWCAANAFAIRQLRAFADTPYRGMPFMSADESLFRVQLPHAAPAFDVSRVAVLDALALIEQGSADRAAQLLLDVLRAGAKVGQGPTNIENLTGSAIQDMALSGLLDLAASDAAARFSFNSFLPRLRFTPGAPRPFHEVVESERALAFDVLQRSYRFNFDTCRYEVHIPTVIAILDDESDSNTPRWDSLEERDRWLKQLWAADFHQSLRRAETFFRELDLLVRQPVARTDCDTIESRVEELYDPLRADPILSRLPPNFARAYYLNRLVETKRRAVVLMIELHAYRERHGRYPETLLEVASSAGIADAFSEAPFRYARTPTGFHLYSIGLDQNDDGGVDEDGPDPADFVYWPRRKPK